MAEEPTRYNAYVRFTATTANDASTTLYAPSPVVLRTIKVLEIYCSAGDVYICANATASAANSFTRIQAGQWKAIDQLNIGVVTGGVCLTCINAVAGLNSTIEAWAYGIPVSDA